MSTLPFTSRTGSAVDPLATEISWRAWRLTAADPARITPEVVQSLAVGFDCLVEAAWQPGRSLVISEVGWAPSPDGRQDGTLAVHLAVGMLGPAGTTSEEVHGITARVHEVLRRHRVLATEAVDPSVVIGACNPVPGGPDDAGHMVHIRQRTVTVGDDADLVEVVSRYSPTVEPWSSVATQLADLDREVRVRATVLATELSPSDGMEIERDLARVSAMRARTTDRAEGAFDADRAEATLLDLRASLASPVLAAEIAVWSEQPLAHSAVRSLAAAFTSESDVLRRQGHVIVASNRLLLGGFAIVDAPAGWAEAQHLGIPLRGGLRPRELVDLVTLTESPVGWPLPIAGALPSLSTQVPIARRVAPIYRPGGAEPSTELGTTPGGTTVALPDRLRTRHRLITGTWGAGKSTVMVRQALRDLQQGRPFLFIDPHGGAADELVAEADRIGAPMVVIDATDGATERIQVLPDGGATGADELDRATRRFSASIASSMKVADWTGPRWFSTFEAILEVVAVHRAELVDGVVWLNEAEHLRDRLADPHLSGFARSTLANLVRSTGDGTDVRGWVSSKLHPVVSGPARRVIAPAGEGVDVAAAVARGIPVVVDLAGLSTTEGNLIGHVALACVLDGAFEAIDPDRPTVTCYLDEAHRFPASGMERAFAEGRKFGIALDIAVQGLGQLPPELADLALAAGTQLAFRATPDTAGRLAPVLGISPADLLSQPDLHATVGVHGHPATAVVVAPPEPRSAERRRSPLRPLDAPLSAREATEPRRTRPGSAPASADAKPGGPSFLDEWLAQRRDASDADPATGASDEDPANLDEATTVP
jgi:hypothetical protein